MSRTGAPSRPVLTTPGPDGTGGDQAPLAVLVSLALGGVALGTAEFATMSVLPSVARAFAVPGPRAGVLVSAYAAGVVVGAPVLAVLGARLPRRALLLALTALVAAANTGSALAPTFGLLVGSRVLAGLPHGAYLGVAALVAASLSPVARRGRAVASVVLGLTVANVAGVPLATVAGQHLGWRAAFWLVAALAAATAVAVRCTVPVLPAGRTGRLVGELRALRRPAFWVAVATCVVGVGGVFAVYAFVASLLDAAGVAARWLPAVLALFGVGMTAGAVLGGRLADRSGPRAVTTGLTALAVVLVALTRLAHHPVGAAVGVLLLGLASMLPMPALQGRLLDAAPDAPTLSAAVLHSATNTANAVGAWAGGLVLAAGAGYASIGWVGAAMAAGGVVLSRLMTDDNSAREERRVR